MPTSGTIDNEREQNLSNATVNPGDILRGKGEIETRRRCEKMAKKAHEGWTLRFSRVEEIDFCHCWKG